MRSLLRCAFQTLSSVGKRKVSSKLISAPRSARVSSQKNSTLLFNRHSLQSQRLSAIQQRFYSSIGEEDKSDSEQLLARGFSLVRPNPEEALRIFTTLQQTVGSTHRILYGTASALAELYRYEESLAVLDQLSAMAPDAPVSSLKGMIHFRQGNFDLAIENYTDAAESFPDNVHIWACLGEAYMHGHKLMEALAAFKTANELDPNNWSIINNMGVCYSYLGPPYVTQALAHCEKVVELRPDMGQMWHNLARVYENIGEFKLALASFDKMQELDASLTAGVYNRATLLLRMNMVDEAEKSFLELVKLGYDDMVYYTLIAIYSVQSRHEDARKLAEQLTKKDPFNVESWYLLGRTYLLSDIATAQKYFEHAVSIDPNHEQALDGLASCLFLQGQREQALEYFQRTNLRLTSTLATVQKFDEAHEVVELMLVKYPQLAQQLYTAQSYTYALQRDYANEFEAFSKSLAASKDSFDKANYLLVKNDFEGALKIVDDALASDPTNPDGIVTKVIILMESGRTKEVIAMLRQHEPESLFEYGRAFVDVFSTALSRDDTEASLNQAAHICQHFLSIFSSRMAMSEVFRRRGDYEQAMESYEKAQAINNSSPEYITANPFPYRYLAWQQRAKILESMGDKEAAMKEYAKVLSINPSDLWSKQRLEALRGDKC